MTYCATGSVQGYDFFVPHKIDVVTESPRYFKWSEIFPDERYIMIKARRLLNELHVKMAEGGFIEIFVDQVSPDVIAITRHNPHTRESYLLIAHCCFNSLILLMYFFSCAGVLFLRVLRFGGPALTDHINDILFKIRYSFLNKLFVSKNLSLSKYLIFSYLFLFNN